MLFYVDGYVMVPDSRGTILASFGPFSDRAAAERALTVFIGRENVRGAAIRVDDEAPRQAAAQQLPPEPRVEAFRTESV